MHIYPNMCANFGCGPTVVSKKGGGTDRQTEKTAALVDLMIMYSRSVKFSGIMSGLRNITSSSFER